MVNVENKLAVGWFFNTNKMVDIRVNEKNQDKETSMKDILKQKGHRTELHILVWDRRQRQQEETKKVEAGWNFG